MINKLYKIQFVKNIYWLLHSNVTVSLIAIIPSIIIRNLLKPETYGRVAIIDTIASYVTYPGSILRSGMDRGVPELKGKKNYDDAELLQSTTLYSSIVLSIIIVITINIGAFNIDNKSIQNGYRIWSFVLAIQILIQFFKIYYRNELKFSSLGKIDVVIALLLSISNIVFVYLMGFIGYYLSICIITTIQISLYFIPLRGKLKIRFDMSMLKYSIKCGIPFILIGLLDINLQGIDRIMISKYLPVHNMGIYSIVTLVSTNFILVITSIRGVFSQSFYKELAEPITINDVRSKLHLRTKIICLTSAFICGVIWFAIPLFVAFLPEFKGAITIARLRVVGLYFLSASSFYLIVIVGLKKTKYALYAYILANTVSFAGILIVMKYTQTLKNVINVTNCAYFILYIVMISFINIHMEIPFKKSILYVCDDCYPLLLTSTCIVIINYIKLNIGNNYYITSITQLILFILVYISVIAVIEHKKITIVKLNQI